MQSGIHPDAEKRVKKLVGWFSTEWERRPNARCPQCETMGFVVAKVTGMFSANRWKCCNCEAEAEGSVDGIDGKASTRLQQAVRNLWTHKEFIVCQHCQIRGYVVLKKTIGGRIHRMCCNCQIKEEAQ